MSTASLAKFSLDEPRFEPKPARKVVEFFALTALFCALIAAILSLPAPSLETFGRFLLIAESVGVAACVFGTSLSRLPFLRRYTPVKANLIIGAVAVPLGYITGTSVAFTLLNEPIPFFQPGPRRIIALIATGLATVFIVYIDEMRYRFAKEAAARSEAQRLVVESQLRLLRAQLEPHMLFNTLANLRSLVELDARLAQSMIDQLIVYLRAALAASRTEMTTLYNEFAQLRAYLEIMALRMGPRLSYQLQLPEHLQQAPIPPMLLQPLVENAIKHGVEPKVGGGHIDIEARDNGDALEVVVLDTGLGLTDAGPNDVESTPGAPNGHGDGAKSYGLAHVRERLRTLYGPKGSLTLASHSPQGVRAIVRIPR
jgi:hypothetical protein